jgi:hypothetical protein
LTLSYFLEISRIKQISLTILAVSTRGNIRYLHYLSTLCHKREWDNLICINECVYDTKRIMTTAIALSALKGVGFPSCYTVQPRLFEVPGTEYLLRIIDGFE